MTMKNRIERVPVEFGLVGWLEETRVRLPLKGVECRFAVCGDLLSVELDQIFHQTSAKALDCLYSFPLPGGAAVYRCEMHVNGRVIRAKVEEAERAREIVREKKAAGHRTALVEMERENLFTLSLGNVQPNDLIVVRFAYFQTLTRLEDWTSFHIPFCPGIRYIPGQPLLRSPRGRGVADDTDQVPEASRISPPRMDALHVDAAYLFVAGEVEDPLGCVREVSSPSHPVVVRDGPGRFGVGLAEGGAVPDRDFVLRWTEVAGEEVSSTGWVLRGEQESYALLRLRAPVRARGEDAVGQDIYFLVDRSGSMAGVKWERTVEAFRAFVQRLGTKDRVWVTFFESGFQDYAERPLPAAEVLRDVRIQELEKLGTAGGTELLPALEHVLAKIEEHSGERRVSMVLITDGQIGNEEEVVRRLRQHARVRVHTFGIDTVVNDAFLKRLASRQGGSCYLVSPHDDIVGTVARLGGRLGAPVLTSLEVPEGWEVPGQSLPDLHAGEVLSVSLRSRGRLGEIVLRGRLPDGTESSRLFRLEERPVDALRLLWARKRMESYLSEGNRMAALRLAKENNLVCEGAAFVAWDEVEKVTVSGLEVYQPSFQPALWGAAKCEAVVMDRFQALRMSVVHCVEPRPVPLQNGPCYDCFPGPSRSPSMELTPPPQEAAPGVRRVLGRLRGATPECARNFGRLVGDLEKREPGAVWRQNSLELLLELAACAERIEARPGEYAPLTVELFGLIWDWVLAEPAEVQARLQSFKRLLNDLRRGRRNAVERGKALQAWIDGHLKNTQDFYERAHKLL